MQTCLRKQIVSWFDSSFCEAMKRIIFLVLALADAFVCLEQGIFALFNEVFFTWLTTQICMNMKVASRALAKFAKESIHVRTNFQNGLEP